MCLQCVIGKDGVGMINLNVEKDTILLSGSFNGIILASQLAKISAYEVNNSKMSFVSRKPHISVHELL